MLTPQFIAGTVFVAFVGAGVAGLTWISSTLIDVDKNVAVVDLKVDVNSQKIDELHVMLRPMWEEFTGRTYDDNLASYHEAAAKGE